MSGERCEECQRLEGLRTPPVPPLAGPICTLAAAPRPLDGGPWVSRTTTMPVRVLITGISPHASLATTFGSIINHRVFAVPGWPPRVLTVRVVVVLDEADGAVGSQLQDALRVLAVQLVAKLMMMAKVPGDVGGCAAGLPGHHAGVRSRDPGGIRRPGHQGRQPLPVQRWGCFVARWRRGAARPGDPGCLAL